MCGVPASAGWKTGASGRTRTGEIRVEGAIASVLTISAPSQHACLSCRRSPERSRSGTPISSARGLRGIADPPDSESGSLGRASRLAPTNLPSKHFQRCACSVSRPAWCNSGWGLHFVGSLITSQSSQRSSRFHKPAVSRAALETATILRSLNRSRFTDL